MRVIMYLIDEDGTDPDAGAQKRMIQWNAAAQKLVDFGAMCASPNKTRPS